jgi:hypothetical protein
MKKMSVIFFALTTVGCAVAFGSPKFSESKIAVVKSGEVVKVIYECPMEMLVKVTILSPESEVIFSEKILSHGNFLRPYNFSQLPQGDYRICVDDDNGRHVESICNTESNEVNLVSTNLIAYVTKLKNADNKYLVAVPQQGETEVENHVYDKNQDLVYSEMKKVNKGYAEVYVLKNLEGGTIGVAQRSSGNEITFRAE